MRVACLVRFQRPLVSKIYHRVGLLLTVILCLRIGPLQAGEAHLIPGQILVKPRDGIPEGRMQALLNGHGARREKLLLRIGVHVLRVPEERVANVLEALNRNPSIEFAEADLMVPPDVVPNDMYYSLAWHLPKIEAPAAWDITVGTPNVIIAILDSGVDSTHPDLAAQLVPGWNLIDNNANTSDVTGHGTGVAGNAVATSNNGIGIAAPAWGCKLMPIRVAATNGYASTSTIADGILYAADHGAWVANASFRVTGSATLTSAAQYFRSKGGIVTVSAGNDGVLDNTPDDPSIITVGATDATDALANFSNRGNSIDLSAPGVNIVTTIKGGGYGYATGTSASAPIVAGVAALMLSVNPGLSAAQVETILKQSADDLGTRGWDASFGWGRINASNAVRMARSVVTTDNTPPTVAITSPLNGALISGTTLKVYVSAADNVAVTRVDFLIDGKFYATSSLASPVFTWYTSKLVPGSCFLQALAYDAAGNVTRSAPVTVSR